ncbi:hypothetical protein [Candidatus Uabimicrobium amorphum]|uniref:Uncharacterized protein n=1 Tax=Uabimicrobium amorphum TaxID=2596890 RepID=A0A5S9ISU7_UABAM|nr:hypothetical protein [Candidatus Uabimicrobium amorphum]BBM87107.1 hypothetical protein UABAM_05510 [Candidatus Uabimicrobium amorphum]
MGLFSRNNEQDPLANNNKNVQDNAVEESMDKENNDKEGVVLQVDTTAQQYQQPAIEKSLEILQLSNSDKQIIYPLIFKYGCMTQKQAAKFLSKEAAENLVFDNNLQAVTHGDETILLHTKQSLELLADLTQDNYKELQKEALFGVDDTNVLPSVIEELEVLLAYEKYCQSHKQYQMFHWVSNFNPRKKRNLKIRRVDVKRGSLSPNFVLVLTKKDQCICVVFDFLPLYNAYMLGERQEKYWDILRAYHLWLEDHENVAKWVKKNKLYVPVEEVCIGLIFPNGTQKLVENVFQKVKRQGVETKILLASKEDVLKKPTKCFYGNSQVLSFT